MLDYEVRLVSVALPQRPPKHRSRLFDDAHVGDDVGDTSETVAHGVLEGKREGCQCLAAARGHRIGCRRYCPQATLQGGNTFPVYAVGETCMMTGYAECKHLAKLSAVTIDRYLGASGGVIDATHAGEPSLELPRVLAEIVQ